MGETLYCFKWAERPEAGELHEQQSPHGTARGHSPLLLVLPRHPPLQIEVELCGPDGSCACVVLRGFSPLPAGCHLDPAVPLLCHP